MPSETIDIGGLIRKIPTQYPSCWWTACWSMTPSACSRQNVTGSEEFFEGHFRAHP